MSELLKQIKADQVAARKAGRRQEATVLTTLLGEAGPSGTKTVTDDHVTKVVQQFLKNLNDVIGYTVNPEVQDRMKQEIEVLERYAPAQLTEEELRNIIGDIVASQSDKGYTGPKAIGMVMKELTINYNGQYDGKIASGIVKEMV